MGRLDMGPGRGSSESAPVAGPEPSGQEVPLGLEGGPGSRQRGALRSLCSVVRLQASFTNTAALDKAEKHLGTWTSVCKGRSGTR